MFGANEIVGKKFFSNLKDKLLVTSVFYTIQGEGPFAGKPALFIRLAKCNLTCSFCDTFFDAGEEFTYQELLDYANKTITEYYNNSTIPEWVREQLVLVLTGGEPTLQNISSFIQFVKSKHPQWNVQIESNGTQDITLDDNTVLVVSPKCLEKDGVAVRYLNVRESVLQRANCLKFVMSADESSPYHTIPEWALEWKRNNPQAEVYVSPMNVYNNIPQKAKELRSKDTSCTIEQRSTVDEIISFWEPGLLDMEMNQKNHEYAAYYCLQHGLKLNLQMHLYVSLA